MVLGGVAECAVSRCFMTWLCVSLPLLAIKKSRPSQWTIGFVSKATKKDANGNSIERPVRRLICKWADFLHPIVNQ
jgi:hypothetical protein